MSENKMAEFLDDLRVQQYKSDIGFRTLVESVNDNMYIIPRYQRKYRWGKKQVIGLVESLLRGLPIPPIYACRWCSVLQQLNARSIRIGWHGVG